MPTYDYECQACGHRFDVFQSMTAKVLRKCPECGKQSLQRLIGPGAGFLFKGDGFYITDYRSNSYKEGKKAAEGGGDKSGGAKDGGAKGTGDKTSTAKTSSDSAKTA
jgi:putative FmdB family regulatory protein